MLNIFSAEAKSLSRESFLLPCSAQFMAASHFSGHIQLESALSVFKCLASRQKRPPDPYLRALVS